MSNPTAGSGYRQRTTNSRQWVSWGCKGMFREVKKLPRPKPLASPAGRSLFPAVAIPNFTE